nr:uncharacterized protein LOC103226356 isoform X2 [Chlorocebus sabaeus]
MDSPSSPWTVSITTSKRCSAVWVSGASGGEPAMGPCLPCRAPSRAPATDQLPAWLPVALLGEAAPCGATDAPSYWRSPSQLLASGRREVPSGKLSVHSSCLRVVERMKGWDVPGSPLLTAVTTPTRCGSRKQLDLGPWRAATTPALSRSTKTSGSSVTMPLSPRPASRTCWTAKVSFFHGTETR